MFVASMGTTGTIIGVAKKLKFNKIYINCAKENKASKRVIKKIGAKQEALLKKDVFVGGRYHDNYIHSIFRKDWLKC